MPNPVREGHTYISAAPFINMENIECESMTEYVLSQCKPAELKCDLDIETLIKIKSYLVSATFSNTPTRKSQEGSQFAEHDIFEMDFPHPCFELCTRISCSYRSRRKLTVICRSSLPARI